MSPHLCTPQGAPAPDGRARAGGRVAGTGGTITICVSVIRNCMWEGYVSELKTIRAGVQDQSVDGLKGDAFGKCVNRGGVVHRYH